MLVGFAATAAAVGTLWCVFLHEIRCGWPIVLDCFAATAAAVGTLWSVFLHKNDDLC